MRKHRLNIWILYLLFFFYFIHTGIVAQNVDEEVRIAITKLENGKTAEVKKQLPELIYKYPNTAGVMYLEGRLSTDGIEAVKFYQGVVDNFPESEWADDALYRIYQYYYSLGLYRTADLKLQQLKKEYPNSEYLTKKTETKQIEVEEKPLNLPKKEIVLPDTGDIQMQEEGKDSKTMAPTEPYTVQVGAFSTIVNANKQKKFFDDLGYKVEITNKIRNGRSLYLVWVGSFKTIEDARAIVKEIKKKFKIDSLIIERY